MMTKVEPVKPIPFIDYEDLSGGALDKNATRSSLSVYHRSVSPKSPMNSFKLRNSSLNANRHTRNFSKMKAQTLLPRESSRIINVKLPQIQMSKKKEQPSTHRASMKKSIKFDKTKS